MDRTPCRLPGGCSASASQDDSLGARPSRLPAHYLSFGVELEFLVAWGWEDELSGGSPSSNNDTTDRKNQGEAQQPQNPRPIPVPRSVDEGEAGEYVQDRVWESLRNFICLVGEGGDEAGYMIDGNAAEPAGRQGLECIAKGWEVDHDPTVVDDWAWADDEDNKDEDAGHNEIQDGMKTLVEQPLLPQFDAVPPHLDSTTPTTYSPTALRTPSPSCPPLARRHDYLRSNKAVRWAPMEVPTPPLWATFASFAHVARVVRRLCKEMLMTRTNASCGLHVHVGRGPSARFDDEDYDSDDDEKEGSMGRGGGRGIALGRVAALLWAADPLIGAIHWRGRRVGEHAVSLRERGVGIPLASVDVVGEIGESGDTCRGTPLDENKVASRAVVVHMDACVAGDKADGELPLVRRPADTASSWSDSDSDSWTTEESDVFYDDDCRYLGVTNGTDTPPLWTTAINTPTTIGATSGTQSPCIPLEHAVSYSRHRSSSAAGPRDCRLTLPDMVDGDDPPPSLHHEALRRQLVASTRRAVSVAGGSLSTWLSPHALVTALSRRFTPTKSPEIRARLEPHPFPLPEHDFVALKKTFSDVDTHTVPRVPPALGQKHPVSTMHGVRAILGCRSGPELYRLLRTPWSAVECGLNGGRRTLTAAAGAQHPGHADPAQDRRANYSFANYRRSRPRPTSAGISKKSPASPAATTIEFREAAGSVDGDWIAIWARICVGLVRWALDCGRYASAVGEDADEYMAVLSRIAERVDSFYGIDQKMEWRRPEAGQYRERYGVLDLLCDIGLEEEAEWIGDRVSRLGRVALDVPLADPSF